MATLVSIRNFREGPVGRLDEPPDRATLDASRAWTARVAALEAGLMRAACGWLARLAPYPVKLELGQHASEDADHCEWLVRRLAGIGGPRADEVVRTAPAWFRDLDGAPSPLAWLLGTYRVVKPGLAALAAEGGLLGRYVPSDEALWCQKPLPRPVMPAEYPVNWPDEEPRFDAPPPPADEAERVRRNLHGRIYGELDALELFARNVYEFPQAPWAYQAGMVKIVWDEARHTDALMHTYLLKGGRMDAWPTSRGGYVNIYRGRDPLERAILYHRIGEARGMDSIYQDVRVYRDLEEPEIALHRDYELADEVNHVRFGVRWAWRFTDFDQAALDEAIVAMAERGIPGAQTWVGLRSGEQKSPEGCGLVQPPPEHGCPVCVRGKKLAEFSDQEIDAWVEFAGGRTHEDAGELAGLGLAHLARG